MNSNPEKRADDILKLGDPLLYQKSEPVQLSDRNRIGDWTAGLASAMEDVRARYGFGRGIAAPQLGILKRLIYIDTGSPRVIINPEIRWRSPEMMDLWDDCMCFPSLLVKVRRHRRISMRYLDEQWNEKTWEASDAESELIQHEVDHLDGILATMRALDSTSFKWRS